LGSLAQLCATRGVRPRIDSVFALDDARDAVARLESGEAVGKVIVDPTGTSK
jgi:NADPH:quinone reductase-like Zn-dependent oxidoreductase